MSDWVDELMAQAQEIERNPHWACGTATSGPCPTGEHPAPPTLRQRFTDVIADSVEYPPADMAWRLVLDAWRVIEVASARAGTPATPNRDEWNAALRVAIFRADHGTEDTATRY